MAKKSDFARRKWVLGKAASEDGLIMPKWFPNPRTLKTVRHFLHHEKLIKIVEDINDKHYRMRLTEKGEVKWREQYQG